MIKDMPQGQTHHCASCEELQLANTGLLLNLEAQRMEAKEIAAKVAELQRHNAMLIGALNILTCALSEEHGDGNFEAECPICEAYKTCNNLRDASSAQSAAWLEQSHIEWMKGLPVVAYAAPRDSALAWFETDRCTIPLYALPIKES